MRSRVGGQRRLPPAVVDGVGVVVEAQPGSELLGDDRAALVLLSLEDGTELARFSDTDDVRLERCDTSLVATDGVVVHSVLVVHAFEVTPTGFTHRWAYDPGGRVTHHTPIIDGHVLLSQTGDDGAA